MGKKVILAEDNLADVELTKLAFQELDYPLEVVHVIDGQELLSYVQNVQNDTLQDIVLILLDLNMPRLGGVDVLCYDFGANAYVCKPIDINDFNKTIRSIAQFWVDVNVLPNFN